MNGVKRRGAVIEIGGFTITALGMGKVWIRNELGEGGEFSAVELAKAIEAFFWERF